MNSQIQAQLKILWRATKLIKKRLKKLHLLEIQKLFDLGEFNEFEPCLKSLKDRFQLSAGLNLETLNTILSGTNHIWAAS